MGLRLILGRAGSGKTYRCLTEIAEELRRAPLGPPLFLLVPEQATFLYERALLQSEGLRGNLRVRVTGFRRLAAEAAAAGPQGRLPRLDDMGKLMLLAKHARSLPEGSALLGRAGGSAESLSALLDLDRELRNYRHEGPELVALAERFAAEESFLAKKLQELAFFRNALAEETAGRFHDGADDPELLAACPAAAGICPESRIWVDGFSDFNAQELAVLGSLMQRAAQLTVSLLLDPALLRRQLLPEHLFYACWKTAHSLEETAKRADVRLEEPLFLAGNRRAGTAALTELEARLFHAAPGPSAQPAGIRLVRAENKQAECDFVGREILRLCREEGYRFREIGIIVRSAEDYREALRAMAASYGISCFMDEKRSLSAHPLPELLRAALAVLRENWSIGAVFRYLKLSLTPLSREEADRLENYCLAHGAEGARRWTGEAWQRWRRDFPLPEGKTESEALAVLDELRRRGTAELLRFYAAAKNASAAEICRALSRLLEELDIPARLAERQARSLAAGDLDRAAEDGPVWTAVSALLAEAEQLFADAELPFSALSALLELGLSGLSLATIPPGLDQVLISTLERSRVPELRAVFVLGLAEGVFPARVAENSLLSERERALLAEAGFRLAQDARERRFFEQYLAYVAFTRPSERLYLSYAAADAEGKELLPSLFVQRLRRLFPALAEEKAPAAARGAALPFVSAPARTLDHLAENLHWAQEGEEIDPLWQDVYHALAADAEWRQALRVFRDSLLDEREPAALSPETARSLYGRELAGSVSRLERFRRCPFSHFASYGLRLRPRREYRLSALDMGEFFHAGLEYAGRSLSRSGRDWTALTAAELASLGRRATEAVAPQFLSGILLDSARYRYLCRRMERILTEALSVVSQQLAHGAFRPLAWEVSFGPGRELRELRLPLPEGGTLCLSGRIDRVDVAERDGVHYFRIIDNKGSEQSLSLSDVYHGLRLQLFTYLFLVMDQAELLLAGSENEAAGVLYFVYRQAPLQTATPLPAEEAAAARLRQYRMSGLIVGGADTVRLMDEAAEGNSDVVPAGFTKSGGLSKKSCLLPPEELTLLKERLRELLVGSAAEILRGVAAAAPLRQGGSLFCRYCDFTALCGFDRIFAAEQRLPSLSDAEVLAALTDEAEGGAVAAGLA